MPSAPNLLTSRKGRLAGFFTLYVAEGLPQGFTATAVALEFKRMGMTGAAIGAFLATIMLPWTWKWIVGPLVDNFHLKQFGRRKQWIVAAQVGMVLTLVASILLFPKVSSGADGVKVFSGLGLFTGMLLLHNIFAASQDVAIDALACQALPEEERGVANGLMFAGAQTGAALGGAGVLYLKGMFGFTLASFISPLLLLGIMAMVVLLVFEHHLKTPEDVEPGPHGAPHTAAHVWKRTGTYLLVLLRVFFTTKRGFLGMVLALLPFGGMALSLTVSTVLAPTLGMSDTEIANLSLASSVVFTVCCMAGGFLSDRFGRRLTLSVFALATIIPTLWMGWKLHEAGWHTPPVAAADGTWPRHEALISSWWIATMFFSVFNGLMYGIRTALFMDIIEPRVAATHFTAFMALMNLTTVYSYAWQGMAVTSVAKGGWGLTYLQIFTIDAALGSLFVFVLPFLKPHMKQEAEEISACTSPVARPENG
jgi:MFS transporter, PAT family, beta-lactamase induction signal transducer AmpG